MPTTASALQHALVQLDSALDRLTSPTGSLYRRLLPVIKDAATDEAIRVAAALIRDEMPDLLSDLRVPEVAVPVGEISAGVREVERTAALAAIAAMATDLTISRAIGQAAANPVLELTLDLLMVGRRLLARVGIDPAAEAARLNAQVERRLQGAMINMRIRLYSALAPQLAERFGNTPVG